MIKTNYLRLNILMVMCTLRVICDSKSIKDTTKLTRVLEIIEDISPISTNENQINCEQLPPRLLANLLGEAYNERYMSINWPVTVDDAGPNKNGESDRNSYSYGKRKAEIIPSFYVDEKLVSDVGDKAAWDVSHALETRSKRRRRHSQAMEAAQVSSQSEVKRADVGMQLENTTELSNDGIGKVFEGSDSQTTNREKRAYGRGANGDNARKLYPWMCEATIVWADLGPDYFPRYIRNVECTKHYCWYKTFICKPKSFAIKILYRRKGICADATNLRKNNAFDFRGQFGELWKWKEVAINFCCDCATP